ncbi:MAG: NADH-quinone oxidoreductase subunit H [Chthoniobacteraceae bacterium]|nr:NADH-quinone oxidoreductase subunit H [Chthoniobacteraceae bacterium]
MVEFSTNPVSWLGFLLFAVGAPLWMGIVNKLKARLSGRCGPSVFQTFYDLARLARKETVYSRSASFITRLAPVIVWNTTALAVLILPIGPFPPAISFSGDFILLAYLLGTGRFFQILAGLDVASSFQGMGASREARFAVFAEPIFFFTFGSLALVTGHASLSLQSIFKDIAWDQPFFAVFIVISSISIFFLMLAECSRIPVDDPNTHLELTMIHEVMILDASGFDLFLYQHAASLKVLLYALLVASLLNPFSWLNLFDGTLFFIASLGVIAVVLALIETLMARFRLVLVPQFLLYATIIGVLNILIFTISH